MFALLLLGVALGSKSQKQQDSGTANVSVVVQIYFRILYVPLLFFIALEVLRPGTKLRCGVVFKVEDFESQF